MSIQVLDANSAPQTINTLPNLGQTTMANSLPIVISSDHTPIQTTGSQFSTFVATIATNGTISATVDLGLTRLQGIIIPSAWVSASLTFKVSIDGINFYELFTDAGSAVQIYGAASQFITMTNPGQWLGIRYLQVRSGTSTTPVTQTSAITLTLIASP